MRVVVTGSAGRVGRAIVRALAKDHQVVGVDRLPCSTATQHIGDIGDRAVLEAAFAGADAVVHVAALHAPHVGIVPDAEHERINVDGTANVIAVARATGVRRIVFTSTTALYGAASSVPGRAAWIDEGTPPQPRTIYHRTKLAAEALLHDAAGDELQVRILRMSRCFPEPANVMGAYRLHRGIDARDVASAHVLALAHAGEPHHTWVLSAPTPFEPSDADELARDAPAVIARRAPALAAAYRERGWALPATVDRVYVSERARSELGWRPRHDWRDVLAAHDRDEAEVLPPTS